MVAKSEKINFTMLPNRNQDSGVDPINGKMFKTFETFSCTYEQAFGRGMVTEVLKAIEIPDALDFYFRPYNDARVIGLVRKPGNKNTLKYFLGKTINCQYNDQLFINEIMEYFERENERSKNKVFFIEPGRTNWGTVNITNDNKNLAIKTINEALKEIVLKYGLTAHPAKVISNKIKPTEINYLPTKLDCERAIRKLMKMNSEDEIDVSELLTKIKDDLEKRGRTLVNNWRLITKENLKIWFKR